MTKEELLKRYCVLGSLVASTRFDHVFAADCFCPEMARFIEDRWRTDEPIIEYIEKAVIKALAKDTPTTKTDIRSEHRRRLDATYS